MRVNLRRSAQTAMAIASVLSGACAADVKAASFRTLAFLPVWVAKNVGFFEDTSLTAELPFFSNGPFRTVAAMDDVPPSSLFLPA